MRRSRPPREWNFIFPPGIAPSATAKSAPQTWRVPSRTECMSCHSRQANFVLGLSELQADCTQKYDDVEMNQLRALEQQKVIDKFDPPQSPERPRLVNPYDASQDLEARARSYLHANCSVVPRRGRRRQLANSTQHRTEARRNAIGRRLSAARDVWLAGRIARCAGRAAAVGSLSIASRGEAPARCRHVERTWSTTKPFS